jgi:predicted amidophosphoribosyltransferase
MALIACKECGKEISSKARVCPHCGKNLEFIQGCGTCFVIVIAIVIAVVLVSLGL